MACARTEKEWILFDMLNNTHRAARRRRRRFCDRRPRHADVPDPFAGRFSSNLRDLRIRAAAAHGPSQSAAALKVRKHDSVLCSCLDAPSFLVHPASSKDLCRRRRRCDSVCSRRAGLDPIAVAVADDS
jgi:hypothetical protein